MDGSNGLVTDAVPQQLPVTFIENESNKVEIENLLREFHSDDYKSAFFLLMDYIGPERFLFLTKQNESYRRNTFIDLYHKELSDKLLVELLGTLKMYNKLRMLGKCSHVYESEEQKFNEIDGIWKILYLLCEELTDDELELLKESVESDFKGQILSAEDWFCWAFQKELFSKTNIIKLKKIFRDYPKCLDILKSYNKDFGLYDVRLPTDVSDCGIALIFNYDKFNENSSLKNRSSSYKDVVSLKYLWEAYGFKVHVHNNLTCLQTYEKMDEYASDDYSNFDVFVCCILSHGKSNAVYSSDGKLMEIRDLLAPVVNCETLDKKPKLFFVQACQGPNFPEVIAKPVYRLETINNTYVTKLDSSPPPVLCDTLTVNSTIEGYVSFRDDDGSWFIQTLCKKIMEDGENSSIEEIMIEVNKEVRNYSALGLKGVQIVHRSSTLGKKIILKKRSKQKL